MKRVAIVVQRCHQNAVGGSEAHAWHYAMLLKDRYAVDVLTTTAVDAVMWENALPEGVESRDGVSIRRFPVTIGRSLYWGKLHDFLKEDFAARGREWDRRAGPPPHLPWTVALQEEFIRRQGPYSEPLLSFLKEKWSDYQAVIFMTYLFPTTYFGIQQVPRSHCLLVPTLHDEPPAYLRVYKYMAQGVSWVLWNTPAERRLGTALWGTLPGQIVSMAIDTDLREPAKEGRPYLLYSGRINTHKGCIDLISFFHRYKQERSSDIRLLLTGLDEVGLRPHPDIEFRGYVSEEEKFQLMAGARVFIMPSPVESLSVVTLEAMGQHTPVLVNGACEVLVDHVQLSGAGRTYLDYQSFALALDEMLGQDVKTAGWGGRGREYVVSRYGIKGIQESLIRSVEGAWGMTAAA